MLMTTSQKVQAVIGAFAVRSEIKQLLIRRYWEKHKTFVVDFDDIHASFSTADFYSNYWFYGPQNSHRVYEPAATRLLISRLRDSHGFADVGANLGYFTVIAAVMLKKAPVFAFEVDATLCPLINSNLQLNGCKNAQVVCAAVGDNDGATINYTPHPFSFLQSISGVDAEPFRVQLTTSTLSLDTYFAHQSDLPDLLKIDVDGAEMSVLRGMSRLLAQPQLQILLEVHAHHLPQFGSSAAAVLDFLYKRDFRTYLLEGHRGESSGRLREIRDANEVTAETGDMLLVTRRPP